MYPRRDPHQHVAGPTTPQPQIAPTCVWGFVLRERPEPISTTRRVSKELSPFSSSEPGPSQEQRTNERTPARRRDIPAYISLSLHIYIYIYMYSKMPRPRQIEAAVHPVAGPELDNGASRCLYAM